MKFFVSYFGCRANQAEIQEWIIGLENAGYQLTSHQEEADFGILNTCSVTERAEKEVLRFIGKTYRRTDTPWVITGCSVSNDKGQLREKYKDYIFIPNSEKANLVDTIKDAFPVEENIIYHSAFRSRIFLKIQDGCNFRCSYCIVPFLRGKSISIPADEVVKRAKHYVSLGYKEIVLSGINLSSYGYDLFPRENLLNVIKRIHDIKGLEFLRLSSLDPRYMDYKFIRELSYLEKIADSFHFSFQSGSNPVLKRMKRGSKVYDYERIMEMFLHYFPDANYGADFIVAFPDETDKEFQETVEFVKDSILTYMHIFPYSPREGTKAALMETEPIPQNLVKKRLNELKDINRNIRTAYREKFIGKTVEGILIEENDNYSLVITSNFLTVRIPPLKGYKRRKIKIKIQRVVNDNICEGTLARRTPTRQKKQG